MVHFWQLSLIVVAIFCARIASAKFVPHPSLSENDDFLSVPSPDVSFDKLSVADKIQTLISGWKQLNDQDRLEFFKSLNNTTNSNKRECEADEVKDDFETARTYGTKVYDNIELYSYYSYLYYYPTIHWHLDKTPDTNDYWVGIYKEGESDKNYLAYQWIGKKTEGSYKIGKLSTTAGMESRNRFEKFELRIFKGDYKRVDAVTNKLHGVVHSPAVEAFENEESSAKTAERAEYTPSLEPKLQAFLLTLETGVETSSVNVDESVQYSQEDLKRLWSQFDWQEQQLLLPILKQDTLPDHIKKPGLHLDDRLEPKLLYPDLGNKPTLTQALSAIEPSKITLTITLDYSYTYVYPVVNTKSALSGKWSWLGLYYPKESDISFGPKGYLRWQRVGPGYVGETYLDYIMEEKESPIIVSYVGPVFDWNNDAYQQIGFASNVIQAVVSTTPAKPKPKLISGLNLQEALTFAYLSKLAYKEYGIVEQDVKQYGLEAKKRIYDSHTDTNGFIASNSTTLVVVFRGTNSRKNFLTDIRFCKKPLNNGRVQCHGGFVDASNSVHKSIEEYVKDHVGNKKLFITGHSLGGALASILTYRLSLKLLHPTMYVYGCPPTCDKEFSDKFDLISSYVITIYGDFISSGVGTTLGSWVGLYKPLEVYFLQSDGGHNIKYYIDQLKKLQ